MLVSSTAISWFSSVFARLDLADATAGKEPFMSIARRSTPPDLPALRQCVPVPPRTIRPSPGILTVVAHPLSSHTTVITALGDVDMSSAPLLRGLLHDHTRDLGPDLVADLTGVDFLGVAGLAVLATARDEAGRAEVGFRVVATSRAVFMPLKISGLLAVLDVHPDLSRALSLL